MKKGELTGVPEEIVERMLDCQVAQGNLRSAKAFEGQLGASRGYGGFNWEETPEGETFWKQVLAQRDYDIFFAKYPKKSFPRVMMVSTGPITELNPGKQRVVFMKKNNSYIAWQNATTLEEAEETISTAAWPYAVELPKPEESKPVSISIEHIIVMIDSDEGNGSDTDIDKDLEKILSSLVGIFSKSK